MQSRPIVAVALYQLAFLAFQLISYNAHGPLALVGAWALITVAAIIDNRNIFERVAQLIIQTAWFIFLLAGLKPGEITLGFLKL
jgi:hypothetical protein